MIRINLLLTDRRGQAGPDLRQLAAAVGSLAMILVVLLIVALKMMHTVSSLEAEERLQQETLRKQKEQLAEIDRFKAEMAEYEQKIAVIDKLKEKQKGPVHVLDEVSLNLPEKLWLTRLEQKGDTLTLEGNSLTIGDIVAFVDHLKQAPHFSQEVELRQSSQTLIADQDVYQFTIVGTVVAAKPEPQPDTKPQQQAKDS
jgi:type IV pilus assembly protein PilN